MKMFAIPINLIPTSQQNCIFKSSLENLKYEINKSTRRLLEYENITADILTNDSVWDLDGDVIDGSDGAVEDCYPFHNLISFLNRYYIPLIITIGLIGNTLSFLVFMTSHLKLRSSSYFMAALSAADFGFLSMLLLVYLSNETKLEIFNKQGWCQWLVYVSSTCSVLSVWYIVAFTTERFIAVQYPLQRPQICTVSRAKIIITTLAGIAMGTHMYTFWTAGLIPVSPIVSFANYSNYSYHSNSTDYQNNTYFSNTPNKEICGLRFEYENLMFIINIIDTFVSLILPVILIVAMNTMLARNLFLFRQRFIREERFCDEPVYLTGSSSTALPGVSADKNVNGVATEMQRVGSGFSNTRHQRYRTSHIQIHHGNMGHNSNEMLRCIRINSSGRNPNALSMRNQQNITKTLLLISTVFICLNIPSYALRIYVFFFFSLWKQQAPEWLWCLQQMFMTLYYTHFSVNFLLYAIGGATFRRCLANIFNKFLIKFSHYGRRWCQNKYSIANRQQNSSNVNDIPLQPLKLLRNKK